MIKWEPLPWPKTGQLKLHIALDKIREVYREESGVSLDKIWPCKAVECHAVEVPDPVQPPSQEVVKTIEAALLVAKAMMVRPRNPEDIGKHEQQIAEAEAWLEQFGGNDDTVR